MVPLRMERTKDGPQVDMVPLRMEITKDGPQVDMVYQRIGPRLTSCIKAPCLYLILASITYECSSALHNIIVWLFLSRFI